MDKEMVPATKYIGRLHESYQKLAVTKNSLDGKISRPMRSLKKVLKQYVFPFR